jgi:SAM-dependent methyltransferase
MATNASAALPASQYLHGTEPCEQVRLSTLNDLLNEASLRELGLRGGEKVLDVGSGLGQLSRAMARAAGAGGRVLGIERSPEQLAEAARQAREAGEENLVEFRQGDALALPLSEAEWGTFDVAHTRFLLEHVPQPLAVVQAMVRAVRPGGRIVLEDDCHDVLRLWPEPPGFGPLWTAYMRTYDRLGNDALIGHRLVALLHEAGASPRRNTWIFFGSCSGHPTFGHYVENMIGLLEGARSICLDAGFIERSRFQDGIAALRAWKHRPDAAFWLAVSWAEGVRPGQRAL